MVSNDKASGMKSAYELALERMEREGIEPPREEALSEEVREKMATIRQYAEARLAELEILYRDKMKQLYEPEKRAEEEDYYRRERRRLEGDRDSKLEKLRRSAG